MSVFSRTASGLANYHKFHGADYTVFIEGRADANATDAIVKTHDLYYYEYLLRAASRGKNPKVKCVGNKGAVLEYARKIRESGLPGSIVIVDKDLEGITSSPLELYPIIRTFGYSWENELWSTETIVAILESLTNSDPSGIRDARRYTGLLARRLRFLSAMDAATQLHGTALLKKTSALCGVSFSFPLLTSTEVRRQIKKFRGTSAAACPISLSILQGAMQLDPRQVVQGHFWSSVAMRLISYIYRKITKDSTPSNALLTHLALAQMQQDPKRAVGADIVGRYSLALSRFGI